MASLDEAVDELLESLEPMILGVAQHGLAEAFGRPRRGADLVPLLDACDGLRQRACGDSGKAAPQRLQRRQHAHPQEPGESEQKACEERQRRDSNGLP